MIPYHCSKRVESYNWLNENIELAQFHQSRENFDYYLLMYISLILQSGFTGFFDTHLTTSKSPPTLFNISGRVNSIDYGADAYGKKIERELWQKFGGGWNLIGSFYIIGFHL